jgi:hypothetical protein
VSKTKKMKEKNMTMKKTEEVRKKMRKYMTKAKMLTKRRKKEAFKSYQFNFY